MHRGVGKPEVLKTWGGGGGRWGGLMGWESKRLEPKFADWGAFVRK